MELIYEVQENEFVSVCGNDKYIVVIYNENVPDYSYSVFFDVNNIPDFGEHIESCEWGSQDSMQTDEFITEFNESIDHTDTICCMQDFAEGVQVND